MHFVLRVFKFSLLLLSVDRHAHILSISAKCKVSLKAEEVHRAIQRVNSRAAVLYLNIKYSFSLVGYTLDSARGGGRKVKRGTRLILTTAPPYMETAKALRDDRRGRAVGRKNLESIFLHSKKLKTRAKKPTRRPGGVSRRGHNAAAVPSFHPPSLRPKVDTMFGWGAKIKHTIR